MTPTSLLAALLQYARAPVARSAEEYDLAIEKEIAFHVAERTEEYIANGMPADQAKQSALNKFGDVARIASQCRVEAMGGLVAWHRLHFALTMGLIVAVASLSISGMRRSNDSLRIAASLPPGIASMLNHDWTGDVTGRVVNEEGQPIAGACVLVVVKTWPDNSYFQRSYSAICDNHGEFEIRRVHPRNEKYEVLVSAVADHRLLKSSYHSKSGGTLEPVQLELPTSSQFVLQIESEQGAVLHGIEILLQERMETNGSRHQVYFDSAQSLIKQTDEQGRVQLPYFQPGDTATVLVRTADRSWQPHELLVPDQGQILTLRLTSAIDTQQKERR